MPQLIREMTVTARKRHGCMTCNTTAIQPGQSHRRETYVYDGRVYDWVQCVECSALAGIVFGWADGGDDGIGQEDYAEWASEHKDDPEHGEQARAYIARLAPTTSTEGEGR